MPPAAIIIGIISAILIPLLGLAATWGALGQRIRALEKLPERVDGIDKELTGLAGRFTSSAESQGARIGKAQSACDQLVGRVEGLERGFYIGRRTKTRGHTTDGGKDE